MTSDPSQGFPTREVARLLGIAPTEIRAWVRDGLIQPERTEGGDYRFAFQDLVLLRTLQRLVREIPRRKVRRALSRLQEQDADLARLRLTTEGGDVLVRDGDRTWLPSSGQILLAFEAEEPTEEVAALPADPNEVGDLYARGCELEDTAPREARRAYEQALALDPGHVDARINLGRLLHMTDQLPEAEAQYRLALEAEPDNVTAAFNLAVALEDMRRPAEALEVYEGLIALDPRFPDAYYNAACLCEGLDRPTEALAHLRSYRLLTRG